MYRFLLVLLYLNLIAPQCWAKDEKWMQKTTNFFEIYYNQKNHLIAEYVSEISNEIMKKLLIRYPAYNKQKIQLLLYEDLFSNGFANPYQNRVAIWISKWENPLRGEHQWIEDVLTHELSHVLSIRKAKVISPSILGLNLVYQDYFNERNLFQFQLLLPLGLQPNWFNEGVAQYESSRLGYDSWDTHRDMLLRVATLHDSLLSYQHMGVFTGKAINYELGPYTQGFSFVLYLSSTYGDDFIKNLWKNRQAFTFFTLSSILKSKTGKSPHLLWVDWKNSLEKKYQKVQKTIGKLVEGSKVTNRNFYNMHPKWDLTSNTVFFISNYQNKSSKSLHKVNLKDKDNFKIKSIDSKVKEKFSINFSTNILIYPTRNKKLTLKKAKIDSSFKLKQHQSISNFSNIVQPDIHPTKNHLIFIREHQTRFSLYQAKFDSLGLLDTHSIELLFPTSLDSTPIGFKINSPQYSPNGKSVLFSYFNGGWQKIALLNLKTKKIKIVLSKDSSNFIDPEWVNNYDFIFSSDYKNGIYNLYLYQNNRIKPLTNVIGGAFQPAYKKETQQIAYIGYDLDGFSLYLLDSLKPLKDNTVFKQTILTNFEKNTSTQAILGDDFFSFNQSKPYSSIQSIGRPIFQPILSIQERSSLNKTATDGDSKFLAGLSIFLNDPLNKHSLSSGFFLEINSNLEDYADESGNVLAPKQDYDLFFNYQNRTTSVTFDFNLLFQNINSFDTITDRTQGTELKNVSNNSQSIFYTQLEARYPLGVKNPFSQEEKHFIGVNVGYQELHFNFYKVPFRFNSFNNLHSSLIWSLNTLNNKISPLIPIGFFIDTHYSWHWADLIRGSSSFRDNFKIDNNGLLKENFRNFRLQKWNSIFTFAFKLPWFSNHVLKISNETKSMLSWSITNDNSIDSLNSFFKNSLNLRGLPFLRNTENLFQQGLHSFRLALDYFFPLFKNINSGIDPLFIKDIFFHAFTETSNVFDQEIWNIYSEITKNWPSSIGWGVEISSFFYYHFPVRFYFELASVLDRSRYNLEHLKIFGLNTYATEIKWGITLGLYNSTVIGK